MSLPPWIKSIKRPLEALAVPRNSFEDLPDTEPGDDGSVGRIPPDGSSSEPGIRLRARFLAESRLDDSSD